MKSRDFHTRRILDRIQSDGAFTQRSLSRELGIALGLTNHLIRRAVTKGWVQVAPVQRNRVTYLITPAGLAERARLTRAHLNDSVRVYAEARNRIRQRLEALSASWAVEPAPATEGNQDKRIVFYGAGAVAEIGFISLQTTDLRLAGVVDSGYRRSTFFGFPVRPLECLEPTRFDGEPYGRLVVMSFSDTKRIRTRLLARGLSPERIFWL